ncbi:MAG TPA: SMC family ATPase, partial [Dehalococcoidia bacterium]|nr:SMC family ATPase [Dehalococcoidia bacterium]
MVPISLRLRNFLCYRENAPSISFTGFRTACLTGSNGHGKSALLDALSWALWGEARAKSAEDLVHHGQAEMEVDFEFGMGEARYRVIRKYNRPKTKSGAGQTVLELQVEHDGQYRAITGNTLRETERKIAEILRLDYETFINSSCLLQGQADAFTVKRPGERKRILAEILGLSYYDDLEERAKEKAREWVREIQTLEAELTAIDSEVAQREGLIADEARVADELARLELEQRTGQAELRAAQEAGRLRDLEKQRLSEAERRLIGLSTDRDRLQGEVRRIRGKLAEHEAVIARGAAIEEAYKAFISVRSELAELETRRTDHQRLEADRLKQLHAIDLARQSLEAQARTAEQSVARVRPKVDQLPTLIAKRDQLAATEARLDGASAELEARRVRHLQLVQQIQAHQSEKDRLLREMEDLRKKVDLLTAEADGHCPLCGHTLGAAGQHHLREVTQREGLEKKAEYKQH